MLSEYQKELIASDGINNVNAFGTSFGYKGKTGMDAYNAQQSDVAEAARLAGRKGTISGTIFYPSDGLGPLNGKQQQEAAKLKQQGSAGASGGLLGQIGGQLKSQQDAANAANEARYQKLLGLSEQFGMTQRRKNNELTQRELASGQSSLISRGLGNSTVVDSVRQGILRQGQDRKMDINQRVAEIQMGPIERRTDQQPNLGMYASLLSQPGALQGGAGELLGGMFGLKPGKRR